MPGPGQGPGKLGGMGGVFNIINMHSYHYAGNNPVKYTDPDGRKGGVYWDRTGDTRMNITIPSRPPANTPAASNASQSNETVLGRRGVDFGSLVTQKGLRDSPYITARAENACFAFSLMASVQDFTGVVLSVDDIKGLMNSFYDNNLIGSGNLVNAPSGILNATLEAVGNPNLIADYEGTSQNGANYTVLRGASTSPEFPFHYNLGDNGGKFLYDPWDGVGQYTVPETLSQVGSIIFRQREE